MNRPALRLRRIAGLLLAAVTVSACLGTAGGPAPSGPPLPSAGPVSQERPMFTVSREGGLVPAGAILGALPVVVVMPDGRVIVQGPQIDLYPGPLMPNLQERTLTTEALARLIQIARDRDLLRTIHYDFPTIADATDTVLTINLDGSTHRVSAYALTEGETDPASGVAVADGPNRGRAALREFIEILTTLPPTAFADQEHPYVAEGIRLYATKAGLAVNDPLAAQQPIIEWPLGDLATAGVAVNARGIDALCHVVKGEQLATVLPLLQGANALSTFRSNGQLYSFIVRPLLPGERDC